MTTRTASLVCVLCLSGALHAQPSANEVLTEIGLSAAERGRVLAGEYVTSKIDAVSERGATTQAVQEQLHKTLLARYRAYQASGLAGIAPYARRGGSVADVAGDLTNGVRSATALQKHVPALYATLLDYPRSTPPPGMKESYLWLKSMVRDKPTYVLAHVLSAGEGDARAVVRREFYASTGYNAEQSIAGLLPVAGGTVVLCLTHAFSDQVAGSGGTMKRSIGSRVMAAQMREIFEKGRKRIER